MSIFVTGTDTDVGKTISSAWLCLHTGASYWKPIQTGEDFDRDLIKKISPGTPIIPEIYKLGAPLSPYDAANLENISVDIGSLGECPEKTVLEGAGGAMVPIAENFLMADLMKKYDIPVLVVVKSKLGMISHTLMTIEVLQRRKVDVLGIVINGEIENNIKSTIEKFSPVPILAVIRFGDDLSETLESIRVPEEILRAIT
jgi:dethiobiotin synthetase/malonyl-CoA O-methyltransferase